jgi:hypothetical protein
VTLAGLIWLASNVALLRIATGIVPAELRLMLFGKLPGLMSIVTGLREG